MSAARKLENVVRRQAMNEVRQRDGHMCVGIGLLPEECYGPLNGHEIITRAQGGSITDPKNIILLCDHHNGWCDLNHDEAIKRGFRQSRTDPFSPNVASRLPHIRPALGQRFSNAPAGLSPRLECHPTVAGAGEFLGDAAIREDAGPTSSGLEPSPAFPSVGELYAELFAPFKK